jgi:hypothetical protein
MALGCDNAGCPSLGRARLLNSPLSLGARMIEAVAEGGGNAVQITLLARYLDHACCARCGAAPWGRVSWRWALLAPSIVLRQSALPHYTTRPESTLRSTLRSSARPSDQTSVLFAAPTLYSAWLDWQVHSNPPEPGCEGRLHATERPSARLARPRGGSHRAARLRWCGRAQQHAVANDRRREGKGQGGATRMH